MQTEIDPVSRAARCIVAVFDKENFAVNTHMVGRQLRACCVLGCCLLSSLSVVLKEGPATGLSAHAHLLDLIHIVSADLAVECSDVGNFTGANTDIYDLIDFRGGDFSINRTE